MNALTLFKVVFSVAPIIFRKGFFVFLVIMTFSSLTGLSGCNTVKGVGEDISGSATFVQHKISGYTSGGSRSTSYESTEGVNPPQWPSSNESVD